MTKLTIATLALVALSLAPLATRPMPYVPHKGDVAAIDNSDGTHTDAERKELPNRPNKPPRGFVKPHVSHSIAALAD